MSFGAESTISPLLGIALWVGHTLPGALLQLSCHGLSSINNKWCSLTAVVFFFQFTSGRSYCLLLSWDLAMFKSYLAASDSCGSQEQCPIGFGAGRFTALVGDGKMDPGQENNGWLPLTERKSCVV